MLGLFIIFTKYFFSVLFLFTAKTNKKNRKNKTLNISNMKAEDFDKDFTFVYNCMKQDLVAYGQNIKEMEEKEKTVYLFFQKYPQNLIEWREWFLGN